MNTHIYKIKPWRIALNIISIIFTVIILAIPLTFLTLISISLFQAEDNLRPLAYAFSCLLAPLAILLGLFLLAALISTISLFFSYIEISPSGIEQKHLRDKHIRCKWDDVDRLGKYFLFYDVIYLNTYETVSKPFSLNTLLSFLRPKQGYVFLSWYNGWPNGELAKELEQYAPRLFEEEKEISSTGQSSDEESHASSSRQETRLLAALSHASAIFSYIGILVPILVYATQKKKSSYISFQALQALVWQALSMAFIMLASLCMMTSMFVPIFFISAPENGTASTAPAAGLFFAIIAISLLMGIGNIFFIIYGVVGAIMTYQGKNFRYAVIARLIEKRKGMKPENSA